MRKAEHLISSVDQIEFGCVEREATPEFLMTLDMQLYPL